MDNIKQILTRRNIFIILGIVILAEVVWALMNFLKPFPSPAQSVITTQVEKPTTISLTSDKTQVKIGDKFSVSVSIYSSKFTDGSDIIINYDPKVLSVETSGVDKSPMILSGLYDEYPLNKLDQTLGKITVSGISTKNTGVETSGLFGSIVFVAKNAGSTKISVDFKKGSTTDSNVIQTGAGEDSLAEVSDLDITITP